MNIVIWWHIFNTILFTGTAFLLFITALYFTLRLSFLQIRAIPRFFYLITQGVSPEKNGAKTINPFHALFTAMSTSIGIGTIVGPSIAIMLGGPGALFWLLFYSLTASIIKFAEVTFALNFRTTLSDGSILGGPTQYLKQVHPYLASWYAYATIFLFAAWSSVQTNVLAQTLEQESIPSFVTGILTSLLVYCMLKGGAQRIGDFSSKLVPCMFVLYVSATFYILFQHAHELGSILSSVLYYSIHPAPMIGGFVGAAVHYALTMGVYKGAYITESGMGTAAIPHSLANVKKATDQGILAMVSVFADTALCFLSGLLVLTSNLWQTDKLTNSIMYFIFQNNIPFFGRFILVLTIIMFATGTIIGNSFNGRQSFATLTNYRYLDVYTIFVCIVIMIGSISYTPIVWNAIDIFLPLVAIPNVLSILYLSQKYPSLLKN